MSSPKPAPSGLVFYPKSHRYRLDGAWVPGVTTLIGKGLPKPAMPYWAARSVAEYVADNPDGVEQLRHMGRGPMVHALKEIPWQKRDDAAARGTDVHHIGEKLVHGETVDVPEYIAGHVQGYVDWLDREQPEPILTERPVGSRKWQYAGTFDLIARINGDVWLLDLKTSRAVYGNNAIQLCAYRNAEFYVDADGDEQPMPHIDRLGVLHVQDGETTLHPVVDPDAAWKDFLHVAWVGRASDRIKDYIGEPITIRPNAEEVAS